jgi:DNA-binding NarL/FixJ family response regulator
MLYLDINRGAKLGSMAMMRVLIVDDHVLIREGLVSVLSGQPDISVIGQASSVAEAVELTNNIGPDLILMDFGLPDGTGLDATRVILAARPATKIVFLTVHEDDEHLFEAIRVGAKGYLLKNVSSTKLLSSLRGVLLGEAALMPAMTTRILDEFVRLGDGPQRRTAKTETLTPRELEVLVQLETGASNREIAEQLFISEFTVKNHIRNILAKLNLHSRRQAIRYMRDL